ncbi:MAG: DMT family transporter [Desulfopila sp.]
MPFAGETIAVITVLCWTISVQLFGAATRRVGSTPVNIIRLGVALLLFCGLLLVRDGRLFAHDFPWHSWLLLSLSGAVGFFIGDIFLFKALAELGPRLAMLVQSLAAPAAAVIGWLFLAESYGCWQWLGIGVTLAGVALVILERSAPAAAGQGGARLATAHGVLCGLVGMLGQAAGMVLSKAGMQNGSGGYLDAFAATQIRAMAAFGCFVLFFAVSGRWGYVGRAFADTRALLYTVSGALFGPFLGVSLALLSLHYLSSGVASTFFSLVPVTIIPFAVFLHKERVSARAVLGALVAVCGVILLARRG